MKLILGILLGVALSIITNLVSGYFSPTAEQHKRVVFSAFVGLIALSTVIIFLPDDSTPNADIGTPAQVVASQRMGISASLPPIHPSTLLEGIDQLAGLRHAYYVPRPSPFQPKSHHLAYQIIPSWLNHKLRRLVPPESQDDKLGLLTVIHAP